MKNYKIAVADTGYVGLSLGVLISQKHQVVAVNIVQAKVDMISNKKSPIRDNDGCKGCIFPGWLSVPVDRSITFHVVQINQGYSKKKFTLRGLHYQEGEHAQAKLVSCLHGSIFNVAVDLRRGDTFGYAYGAILSFENQKQMLIPRGFAHGYLTLEGDTLMQWCVDNDFCGEAAKAVRYDSDFIWQTEPWPMREYILSEKDKMQ